MRKVKIGNDDIMSMGGDICVDYETYDFHVMECYVLTMNNYGKVSGDSKEGVNSTFLQFQAIKWTSFVSPFIK